MKRCFRCIISYGFYNVYKMYVKYKICILYTFLFCIQNTTVMPKAPGFVRTKLFSFTRIKNIVKLMKFSGPGSMPGVFVYRTMFFHRGNPKKRSICLFFFNFKIFLKISRSTVSSDLK